MFKQVQDAFANGIKSCKSIVVFYPCSTLICLYSATDARFFENFYAQYEPLRDHITTLSSLVPDQVKTINEATLNSLGTKLSLDVQRELKSMQLKMMETVRESVKTEVILIVLIVLLSHQTEYKLF